MMFRNRFSRLIRDQRGASAVEFALLAPVLIIFYFGLAELSQGYMAQRRMGHAAALLADMVAQQQTVVMADLDDFFAVGDLVMQPFPTTTLQQRVSSVTQTAGVATVVWSYGENMDPRPNEAITLPAGLISNGESIIVAEAMYDYDSPFDYLLPGLTRFSHIYYLRPRIVTSVPCTNCPAVP